MINIRRSEERGGGNHGWLKTHHTFSFDQFYDPRWMGFRSLRVINEDWVAAGMAFLRTRTGTWKLSLTCWRGRSSIRTAWERVRSFVRAMDSA